MNHEPAALSEAGERLLFNSWERSMPKVTTAWDAWKARADLAETTQENAMDPNAPGPISAELLTQILRFGYLLPEGPDVKQGERKIAYVAKLLNESIAARAALSQQSDFRGLETGEGPTAHAATEVKSEAP